ncbi:hypothetical protein [Burkholderia sp. B21-007]|uniref:hypothetical protein n=1 Tax=Burkholderia sp. B21-007 TaxID=2890407 RepID=UPI001E55B855|nr:hypothetical protein [Burkholderia sp. B21-007]UEP31590.1 hypothetical protein LMA01_20495 [Burkholderia sp. B21-007]
MAGDWIKFRSCLLRHPKVVRIASALKADKFRTLGGLMSVWCLFDEQTEDGFLDSYTLDVLDAEVGFPGISRAMQSVGWLEETPDGLVLPEFETHNGASAKRRAQDADRKREVRKMSAPEADEKRTREEKRREEITSPSEKKTRVPRFDARGFLLSHGASEKTVDAWFEIRKGKRLKQTDVAMEGTVDEAKKAGMSLEAALKLCCTRGWGGFDAAWVAGRSPPNFFDERAAVIAELTGATNEHDDRTIDV